MKDRLWDVLIHKNSQRSWRLLIQWRDYGDWLSLYLSPKNKAIKIIFGIGKIRVILTKRQSSDTMIQ